MHRTRMQFISTFLRSREDSDKPAQPTRSRREKDDQEGGHGGGDRRGKNCDFEEVDLPGDGGTNDR
jgi:hypothetical protein